MCQQVVRYLSGVNKKNSRGVTSHDDIELAARHSNGDASCVYEQTICIEGFVDCEGIRI
jgi:hypothetical protein